MIKFGQNMLQSTITAILDQTKIKGKISIKTNKISQYKKKHATYKGYFENSSNFSTGNLVTDSLSILRKDYVFERKSSSILFQDKDGNQNNEYSDLLSEKFQNLKNFGKKFLDNVQNNHSLNKAIFTMINIEGVFELSLEKWEKQFLAKKYDFYLEFYKRKFESEESYNSLSSEIPYILDCIAHYHGLVKDFDQKKSFNLFWFEKLLIM